MFKMPGRYEIIFLLLIGIMQLGRCEDKTYGLDIPDEETNETNAAVKMESSNFSEKPTEDKSLNKRRSYYDEKEDRNSDFDFTQRSRYDFNVNSDFGSAQRRNPHHGERNYENRREDYDWEKNRNRMPHDSDLEYRRSFGGDLDRPEAHDRRSSENFFTKSNLADRLEWEKPADFFNPSRGYRVNDDRDSRYESNYSNNMDLKKDNNYEEKRTSYIHSTKKNYDESSDFNTDKEVVARLHPRFRIPSSLDYAIANDFPLDDPELCKDKAIIINLKTECPLSKHSRNRVVHKYLFPSKTHLNTPSQLLPTNQYYSSDPNTAFYYI